MLDLVQRTVKRLMSGNRGKQGIFKTKSDKTEELKKREQEQKIFI